MAEVKFCIMCGGSDFHLEPESQIEQVFMGRKLTVTCPAYRCQTCGWRCLGDGQLDTLFEQVNEAASKKEAGK